MVKIVNSIAKFIEKYFPSPLSIALVLTIFSLLLAYFFTSSPTDENHFVNTLTHWQSGIWNSDLLVFAYQMMLILVLGHILVLSRPANLFLTKMTSFANSNSSAVVIVSCLTILVAYFNWGLGLIFGAILVRKIGEKAERENFRLNYPLLGASGYVGMLVWHGGLSGSAPLKAAEKGHLASFFSEKEISQMGSDFLPEVSTAQSLFSTPNLIVALALLIIVPLFLRSLSLKSVGKIKLPNLLQKQDSTDQGHLHTLDQKPYLAKIIGLLLLVAFWVAYGEEVLQLQLTPNSLNFFMLSLCFLLHHNLASFSDALAEAIQGASGILIQFPLYFGIMGVMKESGLVTEMASFFIQNSSEESLPIFTFISAGLVNIFVPSGGGQWAIQGPIVIEAALGKGVEIPTIIMAFAYGDQVTNMLQPFWALPLLAITKLKAKEIFPYTFALFLLASLVFIAALIFIY
ncbi:MAG: TIGR00366 family protein [Psychroflexus maritimus]